MIIVAIAALAYVGIILFISRALSDKWHPDGGAE